MNLNTYEDNLALENLRVFREYDSNNFIANAKNAISGKLEVVTVGVKVNYYIKTLEQSLNMFTDIKVNPAMINEITSKTDLSKINGARIPMRKIIDNDIVFKPQYLRQYAEVVGNTIDKVIKGKGSNSDLVKFISGDIVSKVEKQVVSNSPIQYGVDSKGMILSRNKDIIILDENYLRDVVIPFTKDYETTKTKMIAEASAVTNGIRDLADTMKAMQETIINMKNDIPQDRVLLLNKLYYNAIRGMIEVISFVSFAMVRKLNIASSNAISAMTAYVDISNLYGDKNIMESGSFNDSIFPADVHSVADDLSKGEADIFIDIASNIYNFHAGIPEATQIDEPIRVLGDSMHSQINHSIEDEPYDSEVYEEASKIFIAISNGLDIISAKSDDYLLVFDDIINYAGFQLRLDDRFRSTIERLSDVSIYNGSIDNATDGQVDDNMYGRILHEVKEYGNHMKTLASNVLDVRTKIVALSKRFENNINGEFKDAEAVNELKIFMKDLLEQYDSMTKDIASKFITRLKELGNMLAEMTANRQANTMTPDLEQIEDMSTELDDALIESMIDEYEEETRSIMEGLERDYFVEKSLALRGVKVVLEADEPNTNNPTNNAQGTQNNNNNQGNQANNDKTKLTIQDNSNEGKSSSSNQSSSGKKSISAYIQQIIDKLLQIIDKEGKVNKKWLTEVPKGGTESPEQGLKRRSYNNVQINILPYDNMPTNKIDEGITSFINNIKALNLTNIKSVSSEEDLYKRTLSFMGSGINKENLDERCLQYFKVGKAPYETKTVANGELKTFIVNTALPFSLDYYDNYSESVKNRLDELSKAVDSTLATYDDSVGEKATWVANVSKTFAKCVFNAIRERNYDYFKLFKGLAPASKPQNDQNQNNNQDQQNAEENK